MSLTSQQYASLASHAYQEGIPTGVRPPGKGEHVILGGIEFEIREHVDNPHTGYQGTIYHRLDNHELIVVSRGSEFDRELLQDGALADGGMVLGRMNLQAKEAIELTRHALEYAKEYGRQSGHTPEVTVTGHSLGGTLTQISAHRFDLRGETFNPYGAASLGYRIPEGGNRVLNHVMATDVVSAASPHYGQVRVYATADEVARLTQMGYSNDYNPLAHRAPIQAALRSFGSHNMDNFLDVDADGHPDQSVLTNEQARRLAQENAPAIDRYRHDVQAIRSVVTASTRSPLGRAEDLIDYIRGPIAAGEQARHQQTRTFHSGKPASHTERPDLFGPAGPLTPLPDYLQRLGPQERQTPFQAAPPRDSMTVGLRCVALD